jgi:transcriptional regulator with XRE-family HTH domain
MSSVRYITVDPGTPTCHALSMTDTIELAHSIGRRLRKLREAHGVTAESVAQVAAVIGLEWNRSTVSAIENGHRGLSAGELLALPLVVKSAGLGDVSLVDLLPDESSEGLVSLAGTFEVPADAVRGLVAPGRAGIYVDIAFSEKSGEPIPVGYVLVLDQTVAIGPAHETESAQPVTIEAQPAEVRAEAMPVTVIVGLAGSDGFAIDGVGDLTVERGTHHERTIVDSVGITGTLDVTQEDQALTGAVDATLDGVTGRAHGHVAAAGRAYGVAAKPGEVEHNLARRYGISVDVVMETAINLWRRSVTAERDARVDEMIAERDEQPSPRSRQAYRGHVARELLKEIGPLLERAAGVD